MLFPHKTRLTWASAFSLNAASKITKWSSQKDRCLSFHRGCPFWFIIQGNFATEGWGQWRWRMYESFIGPRNCKYQCIPRGHRRRKSPGRKFRYSAVGRLASRINHRYVLWSLFFVWQLITRWRCAAVAARQMYTCILISPPSLFRLSPCETSKQTNNSSPVRSAKERRRQLLEAYGFVCQCKALRPRATRNERPDPKDYWWCRRDFLRISTIVRLILYSSWRRKLSRKGWTFDEKFINLRFTILHAYKRLNKHKESFEKCDKIWVDGVEQYL